MVVNIMIIKNKLFLTTLLILLIIVSIYGCDNSANNNSNDLSVLKDTSIQGIESTSSKNSERVINVEKVEVFHFHANQQCYSCVTLGDYAKETIDTYFPNEKESGVVVFEHINGQKPENSEIVQKYGSRGSSLFIGTYKDGEFFSEENVNVWYKLRDKNDYMLYLKEIIEKRLSGDLS
jgi:hypothetical protein